MHIGGSSSKCCVFGGDPSAGGHSSGIASYFRLLLCTDLFDRDRDHVVGDLWWHTVVGGGAVGVSRDLLDDTHAARHLPAHGVERGQCVGATGDDEEELAAVPCRLAVVREGDVAGRVAVTLRGARRRR